MKHQNTPVRSAAIVALALGLAPAVLAQTNNNPRHNNPDAPHSPSPGHSSTSQTTTGSTSQNQLRPAGQDPRGQEAGDLIGRDVHSQDGKQLGNVHDFTVDPSSGKIQHIIVSSGGLLGIGADLRAVPVAAAQADDEKVTVNINEARWREAPVFSREQLTSLGQQNHRRQLNQFFGSTDGASSGTTAGNSAGMSDGRDSRLALVTDLRGKTVRNQNQQVGEIEDVIIQMKSRSAVILLDAEDDFAGTDQNYIVPLNKLTRMDGDNVETTLTRQDFSRAGNAEDDSWSNMDNSMSSIYVWPAFGARTSGENSDSASRMGNASRNPSALNTDGTSRMSDTSRDSSPRNGDATSRMGDTSRDQSTARAERGGREAPVAAVQRALQSDSSSGRQSVRVVAERDKLVLRGTVPNKEMKERVEKRAEAAAEGWDVESEIRVASDR
jgi:sporulation protein YlmC with PRC-barrel domain